MTKKKFMTVSKTLLSLIVVFNLVFTTAYAQVVVVDKGQIGQTTVEKGDGQINSRVEIDKGDGTVSEKTSADIETGGAVRGDETGPVCDSAINLVANGSFETPAVDNDADWDIYQTETYGLGWQAEWNGSFAGAPQFANMEFQRGVNGWNAYDGQQYAELDADWGGPSDPTSGEQASTKISQVISTVPGMTYEVSFAFAARPGTPDTENMMEAYINDISWFGTTTSSGEGLDNPYWIPRSFTFTADDTQTKISFADTGTPDSIGTFLDKVNVHCVSDIVSCPENHGMIYARVNLTADPYGWRNWGNGNMAPRIFVGGNDSDTNEDGGNVYDPREYFPLTNPDGSFIDDADISGYRDVPGLAVERHQGTIRTVLYGFLYGEQETGKDTTTQTHDTNGKDTGGAIKNTGANQTTTGSTGVSKDTGATILSAVKSSVVDYLENRELAQGSIEFSTDKLTRSTTVYPTSQKSDPMNPMDYVPGSNQYQPGSDNFRILNNLSQFHMLATTGSDGFYTYYVFPGTNDGDCNGGKKTGTLIVHKFITDSKTDGTFEFNGPHGTFSITTTDGEGSATITDLVPGSYTLSETSQDGWHQSDMTTCANVQIAADQTAHCNFYNAPDGGNNGCDDKKGCNPTACDSGEIWARVNIENASHEGAGDVTSTMYLGSSSNTVSSGEWFMVYDGTNYINDADISGYEDVPGLAVQRLNGQVRVLLHGSNPDLADKENLSGFIEFFNGKVTGQASDMSDNNALETAVDATHIDVISYTADKSYFDLQVSTNDDGFYTNYAYQLDENCDNGGGNGNAPVIVITEQACVTTDAESYDFASHASATDTEDGTVSVSINSSAVVFGTAGTYDVTYTATDSDGHTSTVIRSFTISENCGGTGGGTDLPPVITITGSSCIDDDATAFDFLAGVTAVDDLEGNISLNLTDNVLGEENVDFGNEGDYVVTYTAHDSQPATTTITRTITISSNCDGGNGGGGNGGGGGGSSSGGSGGSSHNPGEVLGAETGPACARFTEYHDTGDTGGEIEALQTFLNEYMDAGLTVNGTYDWATTNAVHQFQALHWNDIIDPWTPPLSPNTTGREYKTTVGTIDAIMKCPADPVFLEDPQTMYYIDTVTDQKPFTADQIMKIANILDGVHGVSVGK